MELTKLGYTDQQGSTTKAATTAKLDEVTEEDEKEEVNSDGGPKMLRRRREITSVCEGDVCKMVNLSGSKKSRSLSKLHATDLLSHVRKSTEARSNAKPKPNNSESEGKPVMRLLKFLSLKEKKTIVER